MTMKTIAIILTLSFFCINLLFYEDELELEKLIKISVNYNEKTAPNKIEIKIKNISDQDLEFITLSEFNPYFIYVNSSKLHVSFPSGFGKGDSKEIEPVITRKMLKSSEELYYFELSEVFKDKKNKYKDGEYFVEVEILYTSSKDKKNHGITSGKVKVNLKCKFEEVKEKAKIEISFPQNKILIDKKGVNFKIELQNQTNESLTFLNEFSFNKTMAVTFIGEDYGNQYTLGYIAGENGWEQKSNEPFVYLKLNPNEKRELKIPITEQMITNHLDLPKGKYKAFVRYGVNMGENCFKGFLRSDEILVEKE